MAKTRDEHLFGPGPKRILALDGGGLRGVLPLSYLLRLEEILRTRHGDDPKFRLSNYFDLIGGTSTGSIIASLIAIGLSVEQIQDIYYALGRKVFRKMPWRIGLFAPKFQSAPLKEALAAQFGDITLGSSDIQTGLMVVSKRLDTGSIWLLNNNPKGKYFEAPEDDTNAMPNKDYLLREVIRASCAAPHYFEPERVDVAQGVTGAFIDGGVSPHNNPALLLILYASLKGYGLNWKLGRENILLVSFGTGLRETRFTPDEVMNMTSTTVAVHALRSISQDCTVLGQTLLQLLSYCPNAVQIDSEIGDLKDENFGDKQWMTYLRYDALIEPDWLLDQLGIKISAKQANYIYAMDRYENADVLSTIGNQAAKLQLDPSQFPSQFDLVNES